MASGARPSPARNIDADVKAQALVRAKLGFPVLALMMLALWYWGPSTPSIHWSHIAILGLAYTGYNFTTLYLAQRLYPFSARQIVLATAIIDPLMLSAWLLLMGPGASLFVCFYLFTILGFGFRIGISAMRLCQAASLIGFAAVAVLSPVWHVYPLVGLSDAVFLIVVPLYAAGLIRKLHAARADAERESMAKSQLLANVSHELRTPLSGIVSSAQLIEAETTDPEVVRRAESILQLSAELNAEIDNLLDSAKYHADEIVLQFNAFALADVMDDLQLALGPTALVKDIDLHIRLDPRIDEAVLGDAHYLTSVLMNLGSNALKFTEAGRVDIRVELRDESSEGYALTFRVKDTGIGIPAEFHQQIFDPFFQVSSGTTRKFGGTGLGTSIAKQIITLMGGDLRLESEPGKGSCFWFDVSLAKARLPEVVVEELPPARIVHDKRILVADDNVTNLILTKELLRKDGHTVVTARSGTEALECLNVMEFDAVILDFNMADMDGAQVFQLYQFGKIRTAPTFFLTADTTKTTADKLADIGAAGVLHKPVTFDKLRHALAGIFADDVIETVKSFESRSAPATPSSLPQLRSVPEEFIDEHALGALREISDSPEFLVEVLSAGISDMEGQGAHLIAAIDAGDIDAVRSHAHALKGVCLNMGAVRLAALASRLMTIPGNELRWTKAQWHQDIEAAIRPSVTGLRELLSAAV